MLSSHSQEELELNYPGRHLVQHYMDHEIWIHLYRLLRRHGKTKEAAAWLTGMDNHDGERREEAINLAEKLYQESNSIETDSDGITYYQDGYKDGYEAGFTSFITHLDMPQHITAKEYLYFCMIKLGYSSENAAKTAGLSQKDIEKDIMRNLLEETMTKVRELNGPLS